MTESATRHGRDDREADDVRAAFDRLCEARPWNFPEAGYIVECPVKHGVYLIIAPDGRVAHVGRTTKAKTGLQQRLRAHLKGKSSFVKRYLEGDKAQLRQGYSYRWVEIKDARRRALVEAYATGALCPLHIGTGESVAH